MKQHYDELETRDPVQREAALLAALPVQIAYAQSRSAAMAQALHGIDGPAVRTRAELAQLPVTRKQALFERQKTERAAGGDAFGGYSALVYGPGMPRLFASPGPIYEPEGRAADYWRMARAIFAAGFRSGDLNHNSFSYHVTPAGSMMESGAHAVGCTVFAAGVGQTEQ